MVVEAFKKTGVFMKRIFLQFFLFVNACFCAEIAVDDMRIDLSCSDPNTQEAFSELIARHWRDKQSYPLVLAKSGATNTIYPFDFDAFLAYIRQSDLGKRGSNPLTRDPIKEIAVVDLQPLPLPSSSELPESFFEFVDARFNKLASQRLLDNFSDAVKPKLMRISVPRVRVFAIDEFLRRLEVSSILAIEYDSQRGALLLDNKGISELPETFFATVAVKLPHLKILNLSDNKLENLPASVEKLANLQSLLLSGNLLEQLPKTIGKLRNLQYLFAGENKIDNLPNSLWRLRNLVELYLADNQITEISPLISNLVKLRSLNFSGNLVSQLPSSIGGLINLEVLNVMRNPLPRLPETITRLVHLKKIFVDNKVRQIAPVNFKILVDRGVGFAEKL